MLSGGGNDVLPTDCWKRVPGSYSNKGEASPQNKGHGGVLDWAGWGLKGGISGERSRMCLGIGTLAHWAEDTRGG